MKDINKLIVELDYEATIAKGRYHGRFGVVEDFESELQRRSPALDPTWLPLLAKSLDAVEHGSADWGKYGTSGFIVREIDYDFDPDTLAVSPRRSERTLKVESPELVEICKTLASRADEALAATRLRIDEIVVDDRKLDKRLSSIDNVQAFAELQRISDGDWRKFLARKRDGLPRLPHTLARTSAFDREEGAAEKYDRDWLEYLLQVLDRSRVAASKRKQTDDHSPDCDWVRELQHLFAKQIETNVAAFAKEHDAGIVRIPLRELRRAKPRQNPPPRLAKIVEKVSDSFSYNEAGDNLLSMRCHEGAWYGWSPGYGNAVYIEIWSAPLRYTLAFCLTH